MNQRDTPVDDRTPALDAAITEARQLVEQCHEGNLDPIVDVLDRRLLDAEGGVREQLVASLRRDITTALDLRAGQALSSRQVAARLLCAPDDRVLVPVLAAAHAGVPELVPVIAVTLFGSLDPPALPIATALAALVAVRGLEAFCRDMGRSLPADRLAPLT